MAFPEKIFLVDRSGPLVRAWSEAFAGFDGVLPERRDYFDRDADAMVSPANSFGIMDGGLDAGIRDNLGFGIQERVQAMIRSRFHGEMPVGVAAVVETGATRWPFLVVAPTMRVPEPVGATLNAYLAFRATLLAVREYNSEHSSPIRTLVAPGFATGYGAMDPRRCAAQMRIAFNQVLGSPETPSFQSIHKTHQQLRSS